MFPQVNLANRMQREIADVQGRKIGPVKKIFDFLHPRSAEYVFQEDIGIEKIHQASRHSIALCWSSTEENRLPSSASVPSAAHLNGAGGDLFDRLTSLSI